MPIHRQKSVKYLVIFLLLLPILVLLLSNTIFLLKDRPPLFIDNLRSVLTYYVQPTKQGVMEFYTFLWTLFPATILYLWKTKSLTSTQHLYLQLFPFIFFLIYYGLQSIGLKGLTPYYYLPFVESMCNLLFGLFSGYALSLLLGVFLLITKEKKTIETPSKVITDEAKRMLLFCAGTCSILFLLYFAMGFYSVINSTPSGSIVIEIPREQGDRLMGLSFYRYQIMKAGIFFLTLWPPLILWLIRFQYIKKYRSLFFLLPLFFVAVGEIVGRWISGSFGGIRDVELNYILLLKPVFLGYALALILGIYLVLVSKFFSSTSP